MYQTVTRKLVMTGGTTPAVEYSRGIAMDDHNAAGFEFRIIAADDTVDQVEVGLQGSNDLTNWHAISGAIVTVPVTDQPPQGGAWSPSAIIPWRYVRVKFSVESSAGANVILCAGIELSHRG
jgi:hypothetical protein